MLWSEDQLRGTEFESCGMVFSICGTGTGSLEMVTQYSRIKSEETN